VIEHVCGYLARRDFRITQRLTETQKGFDIVAIAPGANTKVAIEAKGETSSKPSSRRYG
jgi:hypothetical protein